MAGEPRRPGPRRRRPRRSRGAAASGPCTRGRSGCTSAARSPRPAGPSCSRRLSAGWCCSSPGPRLTLGLVLAAGGVPSLLLGPWGGSIADRVDLRRLIHRHPGGLRRAGRAAVGAGRGRERRPSASSVTISVIGGFVQIADSPARQAFVSALVEPGDLSSAVSLNGVVMNSARVVGPALAGPADRHRRHHALLRGQRAVLPRGDRRADHAAPAAPVPAAAVPAAASARACATPAAASSCGCR